ncbi:MAG: sugar transferase [Marinomonas sp.]
MAKRIFDIVLALILLLPCLVVCLICMVLIVIETGNNPVFKQKRLGKNQQQFTLFKLRTMVVGTRDAASQEISSNAITRIGGILRRLKFDELPQLLNVLMGSMSFVGPRPCLASQSDLIEAREKRGVFRVRPGITGLSQVNNIDMSTPEKLAKSDAEYVRKQCLSFDLLLLIQTFLGGGRGDAARKI